MSYLSCLRILLVLLPQYACCKFAIAFGEGGARRISEEFFFDEFYVAWGTSADSSSSSRHMWYTYLVFFSLLVGTAGTLSFVLGRFVNIVAETSFDHRSFEEVPVYGDLTEGDTKPYTDIESIGVCRFHLYVPKLLTPGSFSSTDRIVPG